MILQEETVGQTQQNQPGVVIRTAAHLYVFFLELRNKLAHQWALLTDHVSPGVDEAEGIELDWMGDAVISVLFVIDSEDPFEAFCQMEPSVRQEALRQIMEVYSKVLNIPSYPLEVSDQLDATMLGKYSDLRKCVMINRRLVDEQPISVETAKRAILSVIHETFHAYQYVAAYRPKQYGLDPNVAARWRENARNYCSFEENPLQYWLQPLEVYARFVEEGVMERLGNKELVQVMREKINDMIGEGE